MNELVPPSTGALPPDAPNGDILIVDDFVDTLTLYEALLTDDGHRVRTAASGALALKCVDEREPELVLLDVSMPGINGIEYCVAFAPGGVAGPRSSC